MSGVISASECVENCGFMKSYVGLLTDWPHICFELTLEAITGIAVYPLARRLLRAYRDRIHHEIDVEHGVIHKDPEPRRR